MQSKALVGRENECAQLNRCMERDEAQLIIVQGRRRVGKTYLVNQFFKGSFDFKLTGEYKGTKEKQLENFWLEYCRRTNTAERKPENWKDAFEMLRRYLSNLPAETKRIVFLDEMPWMDTENSDFLSSFEYFWNDFGCSLDGLIFIICGSSTAWIEDNIDHNEGGLFNRKTCKIILQPFCLRDTERYLKGIGIEWSRYDIAECYMIMGGIPYYLSFLNPDLSVSENIDHLFFQKSAELADEFDQLYRTLFNNSQDYIRIVEALSKKKRGLTKTEISKAAKLSMNGELCRKVNHLVSSGFVRANPYYNQYTRDMQYQLSDYYTLFYFRFIKDHYGKDEQFWTLTYDYPPRRTWAGLTFEQLCKDHIMQIRQRMGISGVLCEVSTWNTKGKSGPEDEDKNGAQVDIVIDRRDHTISLCEAKFSINEFEIDKEYEQKLRDKMEAFRKETKTTKTLQTVMITTL